MEEHVVGWIYNTTNVYASIILYRYVLYQFYVLDMMATLGKIFELLGDSDGGDGHQPIPHCSIPG